MVVLWWPHEDHNYDCWNNNNIWLYRNSGKQLDSGWIWMEITIDWTTWHNMYSLHRANVDDGHNVTNNKDMLPHPIFTKGKQVHVRLSLPKQSLSPIVCLSPSTTMMMMMMMMMMMCLYCCYRVLRGKPSGRHRQWNQQLNWFNNFFSHNILHRHDVHSLSNANVSVRHWFELNIFDRIAIQSSYINWTSTTNVITSIDRRLPNKVTGVAYSQNDSFPVFVCFIFVSSIRSIFYYISYRPQFMNLETTMFRMD